MESILTRSAIARVLKKAAETTATATTTEDKNDSVVVDETKEDK